MLRRHSCDERSVLNRALGLGGQVVGDAVAVGVVERPELLPLLPLPLLLGGVVGRVVALVADAGLAEHVDTHRGAGLGDLSGLLHGPADGPADLAAELLEPRGLESVRVLSLSTVL